MTKPDEYEKISLLDYLQALLKRKKYLLLNLFFAAAAALGISLIIPKTYTSTAVILPAGETTDMLGLSSLISELPSIGGLGGLSTLSNDAVTLMAVLKSRTIQDSVIQKFNLKEIYKMPTMVETRKALGRNVKIAPTDEGAIEIAVKAKTKYFSFGEKDKTAQQLCFNMAHYYVALLDKMNKDLRMEKGKNQRIFIERRVKQNVEDLARAEEEFAEFQKQYGVISIEEQTKASIEVIAQLKAMITAKEVEIGYKSMYMDASNRELQLARKELEAMNKRYELLLHSTPWAKDFDAIIPLNRAPDLGLAFGRLYRNFMIQEKIHEFLIPMLEQAKIQEAKDTPSLQVIDYPAIPDKKSSPKRALIVMLTILATALFWIIYVYVVVNVEYLKEHAPSSYEKLASAVKELRLTK